MVSSIVKLLTITLFSKIYGVKATEMFAIKALMQDQPYRVLFIALTITVAQMSYCLRMFERPLSAVSG